MPRVILRACAPSSFVASSPCVARNFCGSTKKVLLGRSGPLVTVARAAAGSSRFGSRRLVHHARLLGGVPGAHPRSRAQRYGGLENACARGRPFSSPALDPLRQVPTHPLKPAQPDRWVPITADSLARTGTSRCAVPRCALFCTHFIHASVSSLASTNPSHSPPLTQMVIFLLGLEQVGDGHCQALRGCGEPVPVLKVLEGEICICSSADLAHGPRAEDDSFALAFARIECHYFVNRGKRQTAACLQSPRRALEGDAHGFPRMFPHRLL
jgi:hypothetical protein